MWHGKLLRTHFFTNVLFLRRMKTLPICDSSKECVIEYLTNIFGCTAAKAELVIIRHPSIVKLTEENISSVISAVENIGLSKDVIMDCPKILNVLPITIHYRREVLSECGFADITINTLVSYLTLVKLNSISKLKKNGHISHSTNVYDRLRSYLNNKQISTEMNCEDMTPFKLRMSLIQKYLELKLSLSSEEFNRCIKVYDRIRHRPLGAIRDTLSILQEDIKFTNQKIKSNLFLLHADPTNLQLLINDINNLVGKDIKDIFLDLPRLCNISYKTYIDTKQVLDEFNISKEAQKRCFEIYTLSPKTVRQRLEEAQKTDPFRSLIGNPRLLKLMIHKRKADGRLMEIQNANKRCFSLNILSGSTKHFEHYLKAFGDRTKGIDLSHGIANFLGNTYTSEEIRTAMKRHPFWINVPLTDVNHVYQNLEKHLSKQAMFDNCPLLIYPWEKIENVLKALKPEWLGTIKKSERKRWLEEYEGIKVIEHVNLDVLTDSQMLSVILYILEKDYCFSGNGIWTESSSEREIKINNELQQFNEESHLQQ